MPKEPTTTPSTEDLRQRLNWFVAVQGNARQETKASEDYLEEAVLTLAEYMQ